MLSKTWLQRDLRFNIVSEVLKEGNEVCLYSYLFVYPTRNQIFQTMLGLSSTKTLLAKHFPLNFYNQRNCQRNLIHMFLIHSTSSYISVQDFWAPRSLKSIVYLKLWGLPVSGNSGGALGTTGSTWHARAKQSWSLAGFFMLLAKWSVLSASLSQHV